MLLEVESAEFSYSAGERKILDGVSFSYESPDTLCILGSNGQGKSTLLQCLIGGFKLSAGTVLIDGIPVENWKPRELARKIAYIPQTHAPSFGYPVVDVVTMGCTSRMKRLANPGRSERSRAIDQLEYLGIAHLSDKPYTDISGGERQLVMIASALAQAPELLILDEPTAHLDFGNQYKFLELVERLRRRGMGVLMTTHFPDHALLLQGTCAILSDGKIQSLDAAESIITDESMARLYGIEVHVESIGERKVCVPGSLNGL
ncbi:ABC transporter ATP-binding protein [Gordonibacter sp. Marseille-P4307]|uniref:ABC transporter ATP-binding protein n=1 Tax=Gordonibacter sp. Marseille-P4307 TaxID=2161815 RepID=UPI000F538031|nr:ABC transporter ATP-binding protein [Gordonibacter sp. Marseille-P4307]